MAYAHFDVHQAHGALPIQNGGEPAAMFCWSFLLIAALGPGRRAPASLLPSRRRSGTGGAGRHVVPEHADIRMSRLRAHLPPARERASHASGRGTH